MLSVFAITVGAALAGEAQAAKDDPEGCRRRYVLRQATEPTPAEPSLGLPGVVLAALIFFGVLC